MNKFMNNNGLDNYSFFNSSLLNIFKKQLMTFYKSATIFKFLLVKNKYFFISLIALGFLTFLFNKNLNYFNELNINVIYIIIFFISIYLIYVKFNILIRIVSLIKGIKFFYKEIKLNSIEDIKYICIYFYIFNFFLMSISTLFILNLSKNISLIESNLGPLIDFSTGLISLLIILFYFKKIITNKFIINNNEINPLKLLFLIFIIFTPFILLNFYADKINNLLDEYNIFNSIHCDSKEDSNFNSKLKDGNDKIISNNTTNPNTKSLINNNDISNVNTAIQPTSNLASNSSKFSRIYENNNSSDTIRPSLITINNFNDLPRDVLTKMLKEIYDLKTLGYKNFNFNMLPTLYYGKVELKINEDIINFLNKHIIQIIINNDKIDYNRIINLIFKLHEKEVKFNQILDIHIKNHNQAMIELKKLKEIEHNKVVEANNKLMEANKIYNRFNENYQKSRLAYDTKFDRAFKQLSNKLNKEIELEIDKSNISKVDKILNKLNINKNK
jgi:hypothetical protein